MTKNIILSFIVLSLVGLLFCDIAVAAGGLTNPIGSESFGALISKIAGEAGKLVAGLSIIMVIIAGIMFMFSAGDPGKLQNAKSALLYAIIGAVIALAAGAISVAITTIIGAN